MCQEAYTKEKLKGRGKGCKKGGGTGTGKTDTTGQKRHTRKAWKTHWSNGTNWNGKMKGAARIAKRRKHRNRGTHKESMEDAMEQRDELERRTWRGRQGLQKGEDTGTEGTHRESTEDAQEATHENTSYILR